MKKTPKPTDTLSPLLACLGPENSPTTDMDRMLASEPAGGETMIPGDGLTTYPYLVDLCEVLRGLQVLRLGRLLHNSLTTTRMLTNGSVIE